MGSVAVATKLRSANSYHFVSQSGETEVTYYPVAPGPIMEGVPAGALLEYAGPEGKMNFRNEQISQQDTPSGQLLSVVLEVDSSSSFSLFLPPVNVGNDGSETFATCGVKTNQAGSATKPGPQVTYVMETFDGEARVQRMPR